MRIRIYGDPILRKKARLVDKVGPEEKNLFEEMAKTMYAAGGVGLAANQVGIDRQLIVVDAGSGLLKLAGPRIVKAQRRKTGEEGCLSFPGITVKIRRYEEIVVEALNQEGAKVKIEVAGLLARIIQHEIDHLMGVVIIDKIGIRQRLFLAGRLKRLKKQARA